MKYFKVESGIVIQVICNPREGFIGTKEHVVCGMLFDSGVFTTPEPTPKSIQQKIDELESSVTRRNYREFVLGVKLSIDKINKVDADIELLRAKL